MNRFRFATLALVSLCAGTFSFAADPAANGSATAAVPRVHEKTTDSLILPVANGWLRLQVRSASMIRVQFAQERSFFDRSSLMLVEPTATPVAFTVQVDETSARLTTSQIEARIDPRTGAVAFFTAGGEPILAERATGRSLEPATVQGEITQHVRQQWEASADESLHGLGQHQLGLVDIKDYDLELWQHNGTVVVPFLVSSRGYGILWDNTSYSRFGDLREFTPIPAKTVTDADGATGAFTVSYFGDATFRQALFRHRATDINVKLPPDGDKAAPNTVLHPGLPPKGAVGVRWEGSFAAPTAGTYAFQTFSSNGAKLWIDDRLVVDNWWHDWLPYPKQVRVALKPGQHRLRLEWTRDHDGNVMRLRWKTPVTDRPVTLWSEVGDGVDYTFVYGPQLDRVVAGYRQLTGRATLMPVWTLGLWQSRQRYETQQQSLDVLAEFRKRGIAIDTIVQDWFYWRKAEWGSHAFDPDRFPNPQAWVDAIHNQYHARVMISVWGKFYPGTANYAVMHDRGFLYQPLLWEGIRDWVGFPYTDYDAFNPAARQLFWEQVRDQLFAKKFDAWWMDATEPDISSPPDLDQQKARMSPTALGSGARMLNAYALENSRGVYEGQRSTAPDQRVFILTRSGFAGIQRYGSATWSGDMSCTWESMRRQIAAGLGYSISGVPYWSMDIGGFTAPPRFLGKKLAGDALDEWCELNARWFEFGTFVPLTRLHGESQLREPWAFGGDTHPAYQTIVKFNRLRYQLLPYIYSLAGAVTHDDATFLRPLVMDFPHDRAARALDDEYLFGPALLVAPVTEYKARQRPIYLPATEGGWYDFWTGRQHAGGQAITAEAPYDQIPLFVRAGSILPFGPDREYTTEKAADPTTVIVYAGANGQFSLYEDDGLSYGYERGEFARIPLSWNEASRTLTLGTRTGHFPGMLAERTFRIVIATPGHPVGFGFELPAAQTIHYQGTAVEIVLK